MIKHAAEKALTQAQTVKQSKDKPLRGGLIGAMA
jgi:hypothetical protein